MRMGEVREVTELITPGPAAALAGLLGAPDVPVVCEYSYRLVAPLFFGQGLVVSAAADADAGAVRVSARDAGDRETATGVIRPRVVG